jgi:hypothetical protein
VVTLPIELVPKIAGPVVTTRITEYRLWNTGLDTAEVWIQIGGHVLDATQAPPAPVPRAWVRMETLAGERLQTTETNDLGRFSFGELRAGRYRLRARAAGLGETTRDVDVPSPTGEYALRFT